MAWWFLARYPGRCSGCGKPISAGDTIAKSNDQIFGECCQDEEMEVREEGEGRHESEIPILRPGEVICDRCRIVRPCFC